jgi:ribosomal protein S18 acetylase RimI-like enzyme
LTIKLEGQAQPSLIAVPASSYSFEQLADIYNETRVDYIVPMPMNAKRMKEYVHQYDIDLDASTVSLNTNQETTGLCMTGFRGQRAWITRLGVIPERRLHKNGQFLMETSLEQARRRTIQLIQLEVIKGNKPAQNLFLKLGFKTIKELLIIRRPPGTPATHLAPASTAYTPIDESEIPNYLNQRRSDVTWIEENRSLLNGGNLKGIHTSLPNGDSGWIIWQHTPFQITHLTFSSQIKTEVVLTLLHHIHQHQPAQDSKIENVATDDPHWPAYQQIGYFEVFRRVEMHLHLT